MDHYAIIESSPLAIVSYDPDGVVTYWNPAAERTFGWSGEEAVGLRLPFVPAEKQTEFEGLMRRALGGEAFTESELHRRKADGSPIVVASSFAPLRGPDGTIRGVVEILSDVTDRKAAEESQALLSMAVEQADDSIVVTDTGGVIRYVNAAFERVTGFRRAEVLGQTPKVLKGDRHDGTYHRKLWDAIGRNEKWRGTLINRRKDGTLFAEDAVISPVRDPSGGIVSYIGIQRDITPIRRMEDRVTRLAPRREPDAGERLSPGRFQPEKLSAGSETVLLVEDEDVVRLPAREILHACGYTVLEARHGKEALLLSEAHPGTIHLVLTDVVMPKMDGLELAGRLQTIRPETRVLFMSGYSDDDIGRIDVPENGIAFLRKPFTAEALSLKVREILDAS
jgi:PAS domain S-box-containing protein